MNITTVLDQLTQLHDAATEIPSLLQALRAAYTDEQWVAIEDAHPTIAALISVCCEIEEVLSPSLASVAR